MEKEYLESTTKIRKSKKDFATIDTETLEIITPTLREEIEKNSYSIITINSYKDNLYRVKLNVHNSNINKEPYKDLKSYIKAKRGIMERVQVVDFKNKRLDLCIDSMREFEKSKKLSNIIVGLLGLELNEKEVIQTKNLYDLKTRSYMIKNRDIDVCIYDKKALEEDYPYNTRIELKVKRIPKGVNELEIIKAIELKLKNSLNHFQELENLYIKLICDRIDKAQKDNKYSNFKAFVHYNSDLFLTKRIFDEVYFYVGIKQRCNKWLENYRKESSLEFESKASLTTQHKVVSKAVIVFRGNLKDWDKINQARKK
ncbi:hypothetical protein H3N56_10305 [Cetobacterium sp. 2A]|uniref:hypothetical protein n=1 Tax=Cetobacterium sp. 2A TaxID=2754723 RepID=UPI00163D2F1E|nr:hypothetical protein [Cetobacterium sp. 2A]MBC2856832.1 hypothetical protein [Cetobacterium sp. 2A]